MISLILFFSLLFNSINPIPGPKYIKTFSLKNKLSEATALAVDYSANIYVLDSDAKKILVFDHYGEFKTEFPKENNLLKSPVALTVLKDGRVAILDKGLEKVVMFDSYGKRLFDFGDDEGRIGSFDFPVEIISDAIANIYVLDTDAERVIRFNPQGLFTGVLTIKEPITFCVDFRRNIHIISKEGDKYFITSFSSEMQKFNKIPLNFIKKPIAICINDYNEFYIVDKELSSVFIYDFNGNKIGNFGSKGNSETDGNFKKISKVVVLSKDEKTDDVLVLDEEANDIKSFEITSQNNRVKLETKNIVFDIKYSERINSLSFSDLVVKNDTMYFIGSNNTIYCRSDGKTIFAVDKSSAKKENFTLAMPAALKYYNNQLYYVDEDENAIVSLNANNGEAIKQFLGEGSSLGVLNAPKDLVFDSAGDIYIADSKNDRIMVCSNQLLPKAFITMPNNSLKRPTKLAIDNDNILYILPETGDRIFTYNCKTKETKNLNLVFSIQLSKTKITEIEIIDDNILLIYEENSGIVFLYKDGVIFAQFNYKGEGSTQMQNVNSLSYDLPKSNLYLSDIKANITKTFHLMFPPDTPTELNMTINDNGYSELSWKTKFPKISHYFIYRKKEKDKNYQIFAKTTANKFSIEKEADFVYEYTVEAISVDGLISGLSSSTIDEYSFCLKQRGSKPEETIQNLEKFKNYNKQAVENRIIGIYRSLIKKYKEEDKLDQLLSTLNELQKLSDSDPDLYLEKADVFKKSNRNQDGVIELKKGIAKFPNSESLFLALINLVKSQRDYNKLIEYCNEAILRFPDNEKILITLAQAYKLKKQYPLATETYDKLIRKYPFFDYLLEASRVLYEQDKLDDALFVYQKAIDEGIIEKENNNNKAIWYSDFGRVYLKLGKLNEARDKFDEAIKLDPNNAAIYFDLGITESKKRNKSQAVNYLLNAVALDSTKADYYYALGDEYETLNKYEEAGQVYEKASRLNPDDAQTLLKLGKLFSKQRSYNLAFLYLANAFRIDSTLKDIKGELEKVTVGREKANQKKPAVEFSSVDFPPLFPSLFNYYKKNPVGVIKIYNNRNYDLYDSRIEISSPKLLTEPFIATIPVIFGGNTKEIFVSLKLREELIEKSIVKDENYEVSIKVFLNDSDKDIPGKSYAERVVNNNISIKLYSINSITWEDKKHLASFINPDDAFIRDYTRINIIDAMGDVVGKFPDAPKPILRAMQVWEYLRMFGLQYLPDPNTPYEKVSEGGIIDKVQFAQQTLSKRSGDCDDFVVLLSNILLSIGIEVAYIDVPGHVLMALNTGIAPEDLLESGLSENKIIMKGNKIWIPLETTVIYKNSFQESWSSAIDRYRTSLTSKERFDLVDLAFAAITYPPILYPKKENVKIIAATDTKEAVISSIQLYEDETRQSIENELKENITNNPLNVFLKNKLAIFYINHDEFEKALAYFLEAKNIENNNLITLINLGNLYFLKKDFISAELYYNSAYKLDETNPGVLINFARLYFEKQDKVKSREFFEKAQKLNADFVSTFVELKKMIYN